MADPALAWMAALQGVTAGTPVPGNPAAIGAIALTVGTAAKPGRYFAVVCTVAGNVALQFFDGSSLTIPVTTGLTTLPLAVTTVLSSGTTATATYANLI